MSSGEDNEDDPHIRQPPHCAVHASGVITSTRWLRIIIFITSAGFICATSLISILAVESPSTILFQSNTSTFLNESFSGENETEHDYQSPKFFEVEEEVIQENFDYSQIIFVPVSFSYLVH